MIFGVPESAEILLKKYISATFTGTGAMKHFIENVLKKWPGSTNSVSKFCNYKNCPLVSVNHETWKLFSISFLLLYPATTIQGAEQNKNK